MKKMELARLTPELEAEYLQFLLNQPDSLIYATPQFRDFLKSAVHGEPEYLLAMENNRIVGALPFFRKTQPAYGTLINSLPWYGSHGSCVIAPDRTAAREFLLKHYTHIIGAEDVFASTLILSPFEQSLIEQYQTITKPQYLDHRIGQITLLPEAPENIETALFEVISHKTRNLVRKSLKQDFVLEISDSDWAWNFLYDTHVENIASVGGRAKPRSHFDAIRQTIPPSWRRLYVALKDGQPVAAMLLFFFNKTVEYITPVIKRDFRSLQPLSFLIWSGLVQAVQEGYTRWNWGGTWITQQSLHHFKAGWGARDFPYTYLVHVKPEALGKIQKDAKNYQDQFSFYYLIPYSLLSA